MRVLLSSCRNVRETGIDAVDYLTGSFGFSAFVLDDGAVYQTYSAEARGAEFLMGYYAILDRAPKGRGEYDGAPAVDPPPRRIRQPVTRLGGDS